MATVTPLTNLTKVEKDENGNIFFRPYTPEEYAEVYALIASGK